MEKLEKHIKEKLEARKITPSEAAWEKVASSLETEDKMNTKGVYWYAIAASLIGLLISAVVYFNAESETEQTNTIVEVEQTQKNPPKEIEQTLIVETSTEEENLPIAKEVHRVNPKIDLIVENSIKEEKDLALVKASTKEHKAVQEGFVDTKAEALIIDKKVEEVLATVLDLETMENEVTDAEIDSLLRNAQQEVLKERLFQQNGKVDAMALLTEVEDELNESFRDKIFKKLKEGLFKARTAVAQRNQ